MTTGAQTLQSRQFFSGKADSRPRRQDTPPASPRAPRLMDRVHEALRSRHYSRHTERAYCRWAKRFIYFRNILLPAEMADREIDVFLAHPAVKEKVGASTQDQALAALLFLCRHVVGRKVGDLGDVTRARKPARLPVVTARLEVKAAPPEEPVIRHWRCPYEDCPIQTRTLLRQA